MNGYLARLTSHFSPAGILQGQLDIQEQLPIQLVKVECSTNAVDGEVTFTSADEIVFGVIGKKEIARGAMKQVHQVCSWACNFLNLMSNFRTS